MNLESIRHQYEQAGLDIADVDPDPIVQFRTWFDEWAATGPRDPGVVVVSTVDASGWPSSRAVLLRGIDDRGFVFYTNRTSTKGRALDATNRAAMSFVWHDLERQVHIVGSAEHVPEAESDAYFAGRPRGSQLGAWASDQSSVILSRETLDAAVREFSAIPRRGSASTALGRVSRPSSPDRVLAGTPSRLHDRIRYRLEGDDWVIERQSP